VGRHLGGGRLAAFFFPGARLLRPLKAEIGRMERVAQAVSLLKASIPPRIKRSQAAQLLMTDLDTPANLSEHLQTSRHSVRLCRSGSVARRRRSSISERIAARVF
jgi:hypothetical protein